MSTPAIHTVVRYFDASLTERFAVVIANTAEQEPGLAGQPEGTVSLAVFLPSPTSPSVVMCPDVAPYSATPAAGSWTPLP